MAMIVFFMLLIAAILVSVVLALVEYVCSSASAPWILCLAALLAWLVWDHWHHERGFFTDDETEDRE